MIERALKNFSASLTEIPTTGLGALCVLPPKAIERFWKLAAGSMAALDAAGKKGCTSDCEDFLQSAADLLADSMDLATASTESLEAALDKCKTPPALREVLPAHYFQESLTLLARLAGYNQRLLHALAEPQPGLPQSHPVLVMDANMALNAFERLTKYAPALPGIARTPTAQAVLNSQNPADWDTMFLLRGIAGNASTWQPGNDYSEFNMLRAIAGPGSAEKFKDQGRNSGELSKYLGWVWSGAADCEVDQLNRWQANAWKDRELNPSRKLPHTPDLDESEEEEIWFYINGVVTDHWIAQINAEYLADLFHRPIHILHNPTDGLHRDLIECIRGRTMQDTTSVAERVLDELKKHLARGKGKGRKKIVIIAHSQGTIITSELVKRLKGEKRLLSRMEVFHFAFCANEFPDHCVRHVEHFANENDFVALLSLHAQPRPSIPYGVPGRIYVKAGAWGHLLNAHYLDHFRRGDYRDADGSEGSVLYQYLGGKHRGKIIRNC
jgi:hypothetical protein